MNTQDLKFVELGDRVNHRSMGPGTVKCIGKDTIGVRFDNYQYARATDAHSGYDLNLDDYTLLARLESQSQSPQQQTNQQPKEENMKPYAVIYHNLTSRDGCGVFNSIYTTEAEAKEAAEVLVAGQRANLQNKQFFTVTILNTKTGELVGSVTDAPPVVDWNAGK